jgi:hypothetical protein
MRRLTALAVAQSRLLLLDIVTVCLLSEDDYTA